MSCSSSELGVEVEATELGVVGAEAGAEPEGTACIETSALGLGESGSVESTARVEGPLCGGTEGRCAISAGALAELNAGAEAELNAGAEAELCAEVEAELNAETDVELCAGAEAELNDEAEHASRGGGPDTF